MDIQEITNAFKLGFDNLVNYRSIFLPAKGDTKPAPFHYTWSDILLHGKKHFICEAFRESAKSSYIRAFMLYCLTYPSEDKDYIVMIFANQLLSENKLKDITDEYLSNPILCANLVKINRQSAKVLDVNVRDLDGKVINVRLEAYGKGSSIRGLNNRDRRPRIIIIDDPQDLEDANSETVMKTDWEWFLSDVFFLGQDSRIFIIGNNLGEKCLVERIINDADNLDFEWTRLPILDDDGKSAWPAKWPVEEIEKGKQKFANMGKLDVWYREKMCVAVSPDSQIFKKEMFKYYDPEALKKEGFSIYTTVDLASSQKQSADYRVVLTVAVNKENHWFLLDCQFGRWDPTETMDKIFDAVVKYRPLAVGIEKVGYQAVLEHFLQKEMPKRNIFFVVKPLIADKKKELRIATMQPRFSTGTVWFPECHQCLTELEGELMSFTMDGCKAKHDDLIDALAYMEQIATPPSGSYGTVSTEDIPLMGAL